jgi:hypothetical protein
MFYDEEGPSEEEVEEMIRGVAERIHELGLETAAILFLETSRPLASVGGMLGRVFVWPFLPVFGEEGDVYGQRAIEVFSKRRNVTRLIELIEEMKEE